MLPNQGSLQPLFDQPLARPGTVSTLVCSAAAIWLSLQPTPSSEASAFNRMRAFQQLLRRMFPAMDKGDELLSLLLFEECHDVFLYYALFAGHAPATSLATGTSIQRTRAKSMTVTTSRGAIDNHRDELQAILNHLEEVPSACFHCSVKHCYHHKSLLLCLSKPGWEDPG